ncbi:hypothetical protein BC835DRAFT_1414253 [Cytidiella melzeri]|nr:hypothetical protein BC835DRAFT_1414253 [Cytidiella melzeri]
MDLPASLLDAVVNGAAASSSSSEDVQAETQQGSPLDPCTSASAPSHPNEEDSGEDSGDSMPSLNAVSSDDEATPTASTSRERNPRRTSGMTRRRHALSVESQQATSASTSTTTQISWWTSRPRHSGNASNDSLPSLQTISDSSDDPLLNALRLSESEEDVSDLEDGYEADQLPRLSPAPPEESGRGLRREFFDLVVDDWADVEEEIEVPELWSMIENDPRLGDTLQEMSRALRLDGSQQPRQSDTASSQPAIANAPERPIALLAALSQQMRLIFRPSSPQQTYIDTFRAELIMKALEEIPSSLVSRYEHLRKGYDAGDDEGCAVCRDTFISDHLEPPQLSEVEVMLAALPFCQLQDRPERIVAFPCPGMHLFHAGCLDPWVARKTTCPTCRFDIDPDSLTLRDRRDPMTGRPLAQLWAPPRGRGFAKWLKKEERRRKQVPHRALSPTTLSRSMQAEGYHSESEDADDENEDDTADAGVHITAPATDQPTSSVAEVPPRLRLTAEELNNPLPLNVVQSMITVPTRMGEQNAVNRHGDDAFDHDMVFAGNSEDGLSNPSLVVPASAPEDDEDDVPPLEPISDDEHGNSPLEQTSNEEPSPLLDEDAGSDADSPFVPGPPIASEPPGSGRSTPIVSEADDVVQSPISSHIQELAGRTITPTPPSDLTSSTTHVSSLSPVAPAPASFTTHPQAMYHGLNSLLNTRRLSIPLDMVTASLTSSTHAAQSTSTHDSNQLPITQAEHNVSPLRSMFRNLTSWRNPRSPPPNGGDEVD